jgi:hypothetical protein
MAPGGSKRLRRLRVLIVLVVEYIGAVGAAVVCALLSSLLVYSARGDLEAGSGLDVWPLALLVIAALPCILVALGIWRGASMHRSVSQIARSCTWRLVFCAILMLPVSLVVLAG